MAPLLHALQADGGFEVRLCVTAQHRQMLDEVLALFELSADHDLDAMTEGQSLNGLCARLLEGLDGVLAAEQPDLVLVHGDTSTCAMASLAAFQRGIPLAHIEAGLRTGNLQAPWPEEANRRLTTLLATLHFAPTESARRNLLAEGVADSAICVTGNTVVDALLWVCRHLQALDWRPAEGPLAQLPEAEPLVLITGHRRENFGAGFEQICEALAELARRYPQVRFVYPVHLNPQVRDPVYRLLGGIANLQLLPPQDYRHFVWLMQRASLILTDSGGVQEEAPSLHRPVLLMRATTERPEAVAAGCVRLVGTDAAHIVAEVSRLLDDPSAAQAMRSAGNPYGDGLACSRILVRLREYFGLAQGVPA
ncbi:UDP-N-Acetylglucosamine 2-epimerase [Aquipseudomonas alcaligenes]|uniref:UDP-N-acetylglucosamine 2-epimerase (non-hydrolyzing) n=2 Tax=Aquipseudomonas alcaligenes TaxID=43263 RepID=A0A1N7GYV3_AQUAC|nr:UDP-N-Acetylglucosamine 2-epimerase [Pseudomonas alcaligenes]SIS17765.1 UDP-N-Acetylglucosamine 2-epimerase [Pseudomonas alcaligenes]